MPSTTIKQGDLFPDVIHVITDENGAPIDLTGAVVTFSMRSTRDPSNVVVNDQTGSVVSGPAGKIKYEWQSGDTAEPGTYDGEFYITPDGGESFRAPTDGYVTVYVEEKVGT